MSSMTASYQLLFISGALLISAAVLCHGVPVIDTDGNPVELSSAGTSSYYRIQNAAIGFHGGLSALQKGTCKHYVYEAPETNPGSLTLISASNSRQSVMQLGFRYKFSFLLAVPRICDTAWSVGEPETNGDVSFKPITVGDYFPQNNFAWFEVRSTEETGVYKLAACSCEFCKRSCPEVGSFLVDGNTVLGIGGEHFTVRFQKHVPLAMKVVAQ